MKKLVKNSTDTTVCHTGQQPGFVGASTWREVATEGAPPQRQVRRVDARQCDDVLDDLVNNKLPVGAEVDVLEAHGGTLARAIEKKPAQYRVSWRST